MPILDAASICNMGWQMGCVGGKINRGGRGNDH